ncbi:MAG: hypothetical protein LPK03_15310, partial [Pontibacter sp.]|nr:hypothetical protein [Pontibacter sp.]
MKQTLPQAFAKKVKAFLLCYTHSDFWSTLIPAEQNVTVGFRQFVSRLFGCGTCVLVVPSYWHIAFALLLLSPSMASAQLRESFSDGNFTQNPAWTGDVGGFTINAQGQLQSNGPAVTGTVLYLSTPSQAAVGTVWEFWANLRLATSSSNYADIYLIS